MRLLLLAIAAWSLLAQTGPDSLSVSGTVSDPTGAAIPGAEVALTRDGSPARAVLTDSGGNFRLTGVAAGRYEIVARRNGCRSPSPIILPRLCVSRCN
jgi:protocatechuate 3,4-dioxygenase beta subunit